MATDTADVAVTEAESSNNVSTTQNNEKSSGIRRRLKINVPGIISTDKSSKKPPEYGWAQQRLPACRPVYSSLHVFVIFAIIGIIFIILGGVFLGVNLGVYEYSVDYTECSSSFPSPSDYDDLNCDFEAIGGNDTLSDFTTCADYVSNISSLNSTTRSTLCNCYCQVTLDIKETLTKSVKVYYQLYNYYQNHRRYVMSWSPQQLRAIDIDESRSSCDPLIEVGRDQPYFPCGLVANSFFNDTIWFEDNSITFSQENIAWKTDREDRFRNPPSDENPTNNSDINTNGTTLPPNWPRLIDQGQRNESFMVWMRPAAFPNFRKLYGLVTNSSVPAGNYTVNIVYNYPVTEFDGRKEIVVAEVSWLGSRNLFLGIAYLIMGGLCIMAGISLLLTHFICSKWKTNDKEYLKRDY